MGRLRTLANYIIERERNLEPAVADLDSVAARDPALRDATLVAAIVDAAAGAVSYITCGHPPPLVVTADRTTRILPTTGTGPLGHAGAVVASAAVLQPGDTLVLYTDGLIERSGQSLDDGVGQVAAAMSDIALDQALRMPGATPAERICQLSVEHLTRTGYCDDVTVLALERHPDSPGPLRIEFADVEQGVQARRALRRWLQAHDIDADDVWRLELAAGELITNAIEHARPASERPARIDAILRTDGIAEITVADPGNWRSLERAPATGGRGLAIASELVDRLHIDAAGTSGTRVVIEQRLMRPAVLGHTPPPSGATRPDPPPFTIDIDASHQPSPRVHVSGPIDAISISEFDRALRSTSRGGVLAMEVDLSDVTLLASVAVRSLYDSSTRLADHGQRLTFVAGGGSPAAVVLELVGLPYVSEPTTGASQG
jgi:anti-sigma regulatory factor (Ser/Thr protein kinase)/anti-anti-sigma regulatory factor